MFTCKGCQWHGMQNELGCEIVETCMGNDVIQICPVCGSYDLVHAAIKKETSI